MFYYTNLTNPELSKPLLKLSAVRKVLETLLFLALGIIESKTVWETVLA